MTKMKLLFAISAMASLTACGGAQFSSTGDAASANSATGIFASSTASTSVAAPVSRQDGLAAIAVSHTPTLEGYLGSSYQGICETAVPVAEAPSNNQYYGPISQIEGSEQSLLNYVAATPPAPAVKGEAQAQLTQLQTLNLANLGADLQVLIQANIAVLRAIANR